MNITESASKHRQWATPAVIGKSVTITRKSPITGKTVARTVVIESAWNDYLGTEAGMPVILASGVGRHEVLSVAEQATIR